MFRGKRQTTRFDVTHNILLYGAMARRLPSLNALRAFEAAARHVSFTGAAEELNVSHAAVSRHIRDLEAWLDTELFVRTGRGVTLTPAGENYGRQLTPLFDGLVDVTQQVLDWREAPRISLSVEIAFASWWLIFGYTCNRNFKNEKVLYRDTKVDRNESDHKASKEKG